MSKFFYALFLTAALALAAAAQTRRPTQTPPRPKPSTGTTAKPAAQTPARRATPTPTPAAQRPQQQGATAAAATAKPEDCGCEAGPLPEVLATVNSIKITPADLSQQVLQQIGLLQHEVVDARKEILEIKINTILLEAESKKRGVPNAKLFEDEVANKTVRPTVADAQAYFTKNRQQIEQQAGRSVDFEEIKDQIAEYILRQRRDERSKQFADSLRAAAGVKPVAAEVKPPATEAERARVLATVNGRQITAGELEEDLRPLIAQTQEQVYLLRKNDVDQRVNDILLSQEAQKRGVTERALLEAEIVSKVPVVTEAQAQEFYNKNKQRLGDADFTQMKYQIIQFMQDEEQRKLESALVGRLRNAANVQTFITPPPAPVYKIATDDQPSKGNPDAAVTVVEFTDYQCPNCAAAHPIIERLVAEYGDRVRFVVRDFPLNTIHADAQKAAEAAEAAREQGKYWDFIAILFHNQSQLKPEQLKQYAQVLGLDAAKFGAALDSGKFADKIQRDVNDGQKVGISGTPTIFVNGKRAADASYDTLKAALEAALKKQ
ncbi:MAG TPA: thioredoxin domain-containing protein [Pyrinomonadaceae bacterium]|jgi:protein-disulfide isomerase|nr:thioredoxin domain-containing protein [Pyrinomonadaceae bacterium]